MLLAALADLNCLRGSLSIGLRPLDGDVLSNLQVGLRAHHDLLNHGLSTNTYGDRASILLR